MSGPFIVVARAANGVIGRDYALPWRLPADLKRFKALTLGHAVIMGRRTFESIGRPLPGRRNIVLTRDTAWNASGVEIAAGLPAALRLAEEAAVIGGEAVYAEALALAVRIEITEVHRAYEGDARLPAFDEDLWRETFCEDHAASHDQPAFTFRTLIRR